jgi:hypothetical protein
VNNNNTVSSRSVLENGPESSHPPFDLFKSVCPRTIISQSEITVLGYIELADDEALLNDAEFYGILISIESRSVNDSAEYEV